LDLKHLINRSWYKLFLGVFSGGHDDVLLASMINQLINATWTLSLGIRRIWRTEFDWCIGKNTEH